MDNKLNNILDLFELIREHDLRFEVEFFEELHAYKITLHRNGFVYTQGCFEERLYSSPDFIKFFIESMAERLVYESTQDELNVPLRNRHVSDVDRIEPKKHYTRPYKVKTMIYSNLGVSTHDDIIAATSISDAYRYSRRKYIEQYGYNFQIIGVREVKE